MEQQEHKINVADFYDWFSEAWEILLGEGEHIHIGFYDLNAHVPKTISGHMEAQIRLIEEALRFAGFSDNCPEKRPKNVLDVGCGMGGSSRYLAKKYGASFHGITLSPYQAQKATELTAAQGLAEKISFQVADATEQPFPDGKFDLVWSIECLEHVNDKKKFMSELARVVAPGGTIVILTLCCRPFGPSEESLQPSELKHLKRISDLAQLAQEWYSADDYMKLLEALPVNDIKSADWSKNAATFISAVIRSFFTWRGLKLLWHGGFRSIKLAQIFPLISEGKKKGLIKYAIITCRKPE